MIDFLHLEHTLDNLQIDITPKTAEEILEHISFQLDLKECRYCDLDPIAGDILRTHSQLQAKAGACQLPLERMNYYVVLENERSWDIYQDFLKHYPYSPFVYLYLDRTSDIIDSNCSLLSLRLSILRGIDRVHIKQKDNTYRAFLVRAESYSQALNACMAGEPVVRRQIPGTENFFGSLTQA